MCAFFDPLWVELTVCVCWLKEQKHCWTSTSALILYEQNMSTVDDLKATANNDEVANGRKSPEAKKEETMMTKTPTTATKRGEARTSCVIKKTLLRWWSVFHLLFQFFDSKRTARRDVGQNKSIQIPMICYPIQVFFFTVGSLWASEIFFPIVLSSLLFSIFGEIRAVYLLFFGVSGWIQMKSMLNRLEFKAFK